MHITTRKVVHDKGKPVARRGRKATDLSREVAGLPKGELPCIPSEKPNSIKEVLPKRASGRPQRPGAIINRNRGIPMYDPRLTRGGADDEPRCLLRRHASIVPLAALPAIPAAHVASASPVVARALRVGGVFLLTLLLALAFAAISAAQAEAESRIKTNGCTVYDVNRADSIAVGSGHLHEQIGNVTHTSSSTGRSLKANGSPDCLSASSWFTSAGWYPTPKNQDAERVAVYYRDPGDTNNLRAIPTGLKMLTHDKSFVNGSTITTFFPNCVAVDGAGRPVLDSVDHMSHLENKGSSRCDSSHPYRIPQLNYLIQFPNSIGSDTLVSMGVNRWASAGSSFHADYHAANQSVFNNRLIDLCLNNVSNSVKVAHPDCGKEGANQ